MYSLNSTFFLTTLWLFSSFSQAQALELFEAMQGGDPSKIAHAIQETTDIDARNEVGDTALLLAARAGNLDALTLLVEAGADINAQDRNKRGILNIAITTQNLDLARHSLLLGADPTAVTSVYEGGAIIYGSAKGDVAIVELLISADAPVNRVNNLGWTALLEVAILGDGSEPYLQIAKMLIDGGADPGQKDKDGLVAYDHASAKDHHELAEILLRNE